MRLLLFVFVLLAACVQKPAHGLKPEEINEYLTGYTQGFIDVNEPIIVQFADKLVPLRDTIESLDIVISPEHPVRTSYTQGLLKIVPQQPFKPGTPYHLTLNLAQIFREVDKTVSLKVETKRQFLTVAFDEFYFQQPNNTDQISVKGHVQLAVYADLDQVSKVLSASSGNVSVPVTWLDKTGDHEYNFVLENLPRKSSAYEVDLKWNGLALGLNETQGQKQINIPADGEFFVLDYGISDPETQAVKIQFSEPLAPNQDFTGLVRLEGSEVSLRFQHDVNLLLVYPSTPMQGTFDLLIEEQLKSNAHKTLDKNYRGALTFESQNPALRLAAKGHIIPVTGQPAFPFEAVNLEKVDVEIYRIYQNNILHFLQVNGLGTNYELERVANRVFQQTIDLGKQVPSADLARWNRYQVDLKTLVSQDPQGIYQIKLSFRPQYALTSCSGILSDEENQTFASPWDYPYYGPQGYYNNYWEDRTDPCKSAYYNQEKFISQNILASDLGLMAKRGSDQRLMVVANRISDASPLNEVSLDFYDYALQKQGSGKTGVDGVCSLDLTGEPSFVVASNGHDKNYLQLLEGYALPLSRFDVGGETRQEGLRCFIFGERGVWRPGDTIFMHAIIDTEKELPANFPLKFKFQDPQGKLISSGLVTRRAGNLCALRLVTAPDAPTGDWSLRLETGGAQFYKKVKVESIKPNRLKMSYLQLKEEMFLSDQVQLTLQAQWLHGAAGSDLLTKVERRMKSIKTNFIKYSDYQFDDLTRANALSREAEVIFEARTDADGRAEVGMPGELNEMPGKVEIELLTRIFEKSGESNVMVNNFIYSPYRSYAGVKVEARDAEDNYFPRDKVIDIQIVSIDEQGKVLAGNGLDLGIYKINWYYWWESGAANELLQYSSSDVANAAVKATLTTDAQGKGVYRYTPQQYGTYLIKVCDRASGHCTSKIIYVGYPWEDGDNKEAVTMLSLSTDQDKYALTEVCKLKIPALNPGKALITIEKGSKVLKYFWQDINRGQNVIDIGVEAEMSPVSYISVALLQGYSTSSSDLPLRQYGIVPVEVNNPEQKLEPIIQAPEEFRPGKPLEISVKESRGQPMNYILAVVDEGLLGLTSFKTPDPHKYFNAKEALRVSTWDLYDQVFNLQPSEFGRWLAVGGDEGARPTNPEKALRFEPVVRVLGPFSLAAGKNQSHSILIKNYIGEVRAMVIATGNNIYGQQEKAIKIKNPLMVLATLPRILTPGAHLLVPVNVFSTKAGLGQIKISLTDKAKLAIIPNRQTSLTLNKIGDEIVYFELEVPEKEGEINLLVEAVAGSESASQEITLQVINPNPTIRDFQNAVVGAQSTILLKAKAPGLPGSNTGLLELSYLPPIQFRDRLDQLIDYPYGCAEQQVSGAFPQLFLEDLTDLTSDQLRSIQSNVMQVIQNLAAFQNADGGFSLWPRQVGNDEWVTSYAGHFLIYAQQKGYPVPVHMLEGWKKIQQRLAKSWDPLLDKYQKPYALQGSAQIYRLYTLALAGVPEIGAMNRLMETDFLNAQSQWQLAAAYALLGKKSIANKIIQKSSVKPDVLADWEYTYGSPLRDQAVILEALYDLGRTDAAFELCKEISKLMASGAEFSTQTLGYSLAVLGKVYKSLKGDKMWVNYRLKNGDWNKVNTPQPILITTWQAQNLKSEEIEIQNLGSKPIFARWTLQGQPVKPQVTEVSKNLSIAVRYQDINGGDLDVTNLKQGTELRCLVTISNTAKRRIRHLALNQVIPAGWEIVPVRLGSSGQANQNFDYQDIRDDRVYTFFGLNAGEKKTFTTRFTTNYPGKFVLPPVLCEGMYDPNVQSIVPGQIVQVIK